MPNNKDMSIAVDHHGGGDTNVSGRTRRRSGRMISTAEESDKHIHVAVQQNTPTDGRSLRRRTRSGTVPDGVGNGPSERPKDSESNSLQPEPHATEAQGTHKTSGKVATTTDVNLVDTRKGIVEDSFSNKHK